MTDSPHRLRLVGSRRSRVHTRRVTVAPYRAPWAVYAMLAWVFALGWTLGAWFPPIGTGRIPVGVVAVAVVASVLASRRR